MRRYWDRFKWWSRRLGRSIQAVVITVLLALVYVIGLGLTRLGAELFSRRYLKLYSMDRSKGSLWVDAEGYEANRLDRQF
ncbi:MAG: hypothetical protein CME06_13375 [Gemmatimonadetes bacterium]|nr:hypothetical protein [Gemmatimonadota bacterium]